MLAGLLATIALAQAAPAPAATAAAAEVRPVYVVTYRQGPAWIAGQPMRRQRLAPHLRYMQRLLREGRLIAGGPFTGENAGMALIHADSLAEARAVLAADPAIIGGVFVGTVAGWEPRVDSRKPIVR